MLIVLAWFVDYVIFQFELSVLICVCVRFFFFWGQKMAKRIQMMMVQRIIHNIQLYMLVTLLTRQAFISLLFDFVQASTSLLYIQISVVFKINHVMKLVLML